MFWVVQDNLYREYNHTILIETLKRLDIPHVEVKVAAFINKLLPSNFDYTSYKGDINDIDEVKIDSDQIMVCGGISLAKIAQSRNWKPGSFLNKNFHYNKWKDAYDNNLLNYESIVDTFQNIDPNWNEFFIRPCEDTKDFDGKVFIKEKFKNWQCEWLKTNESCPFKNNLVVASPLKEIYAEFRFFVVDGKVVTCSQYKSGGRLFLSEYVDTDTINFAQKMVDIWQPARAFVIDIALTPEGLKIIEINNINSAGFYAINIGKYIDAIENMKF